jgi:hypothetical protein
MININQYFRVGATDLARAHIACMSSGQKARFAEERETWREGVSLQVALSSAAGYVTTDEVLDTIESILRGE